MIEQLAAATGRLTAFASERGRGEWWVIVAPTDGARLVGNHYAEFGPYTRRSVNTAREKILTYLRTRGYAP